MNFIRKPLAQAIAIAIATFAFAASAHADLVVWDWNNTDQNYSVDVSGLSSNLNPTTLHFVNVTTPGAFTALMAYCFDAHAGINADMTNFGAIDPHNPNASGNTYDAAGINFNSVELAASTGYSTDIQKLFNTAYAASINDTIKGAAFQLALWELQNGLPEAAATTSLGIGIPDASAVLSQVHDDLTALNGTQNGTYKIMKWTAAAGYLDSNNAVADSQTFLTATKVPEPATDLLAALGVLGLVLARRKRAA